MESIGKRIERLRKERGLTQYDLARMAECGSATVYRMESGTETFFSTIVRIARVFKVSLDYLAYGDQETIKPVPGIVKIYEDGH